MSGCLALSGSGDSQGDPIQYWFGATITTPGGGQDSETGELFEVAGLDDPFAGLGWGFNGADSASESGLELILHRDERLPEVTDPEDSFPQFELACRGVPERLAGPFDPHTGTVVPGRIEPTRRTSA